MNAEINLSYIEHIPCARYIGTVMCACSDIVGAGLPAVSCWHSMFCIAVLHVDKVWLTIT